MKLSGGCSAMIAAVILVLGLLALLLPSVDSGHRYKFELEFTAADEETGSPIEGVVIAVDPSIADRESLDDVVTDAKGIAVVGRYVFVNDRAQGWTRWKFEVPAECCVRATRAGYQPIHVALQELLDKASKNPKLKTASLTIRMHRSK